MTVRWKNYHRRKMEEDKELRLLVEEELNKLRVGVEIARLRKEKGLTQSKLAARAGLSAAKISAIEKSPGNLTLKTLARIAVATDRRLEVRFSR